MRGDLLSPNFVLEDVTFSDMQIASLAWGYTIGFGYLTGAKAAGQTMKVWRRSGSINKPYIWLIWLEMLVSVAFGIICWLYLNHNIPPCFAFYFSILTLWALQVQFLLQIIINRISVLLIDKQKAARIKWGVAALITAVNISVYCIWIPARLQVSERYVQINDVWDRCEKAIYLVVDGLLNAYFIYTVRSKLMAGGLTKYNRLYYFNCGIVGASLAMDVLIISMMSLPNSFVYMQFHSVAYLSKLNIEMSMARLIGKVSQAPGGNTGEVQFYEPERTTSKVSRKTSNDSQDFDYNSKSYPTDIEALDYIESSSTDIAALDDIDPSSD